MQYVLLFLVLLLGMFVGVFGMLWLLKPSYKPTEFQKAKDRPSEDEEDTIHKDVEKDESLAAEVKSEIPEPAQETPFQAKLHKKDEDCNIATVRELTCLMEGIDPDEHVQEMQKWEDDSYRVLKANYFDSAQKKKKRKKEKKSNTSPAPNSSI